MSGWTPIHDAGEIVGEYVRRHLGGYRLVLLGLRMGSYWIGGPTTSMLYFLASARSVSASAPCLEHLLGPPGVRCLAATQEAGAVLASFRRIGFICVEKPSRNRCCGSR
jgi:hypothetical protein